MQPNLSLKKERERRGWSQAKVASEIGVEPHSISRWERGVSQPYPFYREKLCALFGTDVETLGLFSTATEADSVGFDQIDPASTVLLPSEETLFDSAIPQPPTCAGELAGRSALLGQLKRHLLEMQPGAVMLLQGLPGSGKTVLACLLAHDPEVRAHFHMGILWAGVGPTPRIRKHLVRWETLLDCLCEKDATDEERVEAIRAQVEQKPALFILDDIWDIEKLQALKGGGNNCCYLVTSRLPQVARFFASEEVWTVPELDEQDSLKLLARFVLALIEKDIDGARMIIQVAGGLPFALAALGTYLRTQEIREQPHRLHTAIRRVRDTAFRLHLHMPTASVDCPPSLLAGTPLTLSTLIAASEQRIDKYERKALQALAVFPAKPNSFAEEAALTICQMPIEVLEGLSDAGLLESSAPRRYHLHPTIRDYARLQSIDAYETVQRFVLYMIQYVEEHAMDYSALEQEYENILAAIEQAHMHMLYAEYIRGVLAFSSFLLLRGLYTFANNLLLQAYQYALAEQDIPHLLLLLTYLLQIAREQNQIYQAEVYLRDGLRYAQNQADEKMMKHFLVSLSEILEQRREYDRLHAPGSQIGIHQLTSRAWPLAQYRPRDGASLEQKYVHFTEPQKLLHHGALADIDEIFRSWKYANSFHPTYLKIVTGSDQHIYGLPTEAYVLCLVYNRRHFREVGLDPDRPPTSWEEFRAMAHQLTDLRRGRYGFAETTTRNMGGWHFTNWLYTAGVEVVLQKTEEKPQRRSFAVLLLCLDGHFELFRDERCLSQAVSFAYSLYLSFAHHVHHLISL